MCNTLEMTNLWERETEWCPGIGRGRGTWRRCERVTREALGCEDASVLVVVLYCHLTIEGGWPKGTSISLYYFLKLHVNRQLSHFLKKFNFKVLSEGKRNVHARTSVNSCWGMQIDLARKSGRTLRSLWDWWSWIYNNRNLLYWGAFIPCFHPVSGWRNRGNRWLSHSGYRCQQTGAATTNAGRFFSNPTLPFLSALQQPGWGAEFWLWAKQREHTLSSSLWSLLLPPPHHSQRASGKGMRTQVCPI